MSDRFQGDPALYMDENGSRMVFRGGQPEMDRGLENAVKISLFTRPGWAGNTLFDLDDEKIGSDFEDTNETPITVQSLADREDAVQKALAWMISQGLASDIGVTISNPAGQILLYNILITPPGRDSFEILIQKNGLNWIEQANDPAHGRE